jgi:replicative DNA helicase
MDDERLPPADTEAERQLLGCLMVNADRFPEAASIVDPADFYNVSNKVLFRRMSEWVSFDCGELNIETLGSYLKDTEDFAGPEFKSDFEYYGGWSGLSEITQAAILPESVTAYARRIRALRIKREALYGQDQIRDYANNGKGPDEVIEAIQSLSDSLSVLLPGEAEASLTVTCDSLIKELPARLDRELMGLSSGLNDLDSLTHGWAPGQFIIIAGRPGMYKTQLALNLTIPTKPIKRPFQTLYISMEMSKQELVERLLCQIGELHNDLLKRGTIGEHEARVLASARERLLDAAPIILDDADSLGKLAGIEAQIIKRKRTDKPIELLIYDYVGLCEGGSKKAEASRQEEIAAFSRGLKKMAKRHKIPIIALVQVTRGPDARANKRPMLSDLRDSGALEQDADVVLFTYYEPNYNPEAKEKHCLEIIVAKNRHGQQGTIYARVNPETGQISNSQDPYWRPDYGKAPDKPKTRYGKGGSTHAANIQQQAEEKQS